METDERRSQSGLPDAWDLDDVPKNFWFVQFSLTSDDRLIAQPRLVAVSKRNGEIVYEKRATDRKAKSRKAR
jgi:hypothetical protein